jgi:hypothetical protein
MLMGKREKLMSSGRKANRKTPQFDALFDKLPKDIKLLAKKAYKLFCLDPSHPSLRHHVLEDTRKGKHRKGSCSISITMRYRAVYVPLEDANVWYWIGTHAEYKNFTGG